MTPIGKKSDLPKNGCKEFKLTNKSIFVVALEAHQYAAYVNECPHLGVDLNWAPEKFLDAKGEYIQCGMHGALFKKDDGECIHGPCLGSFLQPVALVIEDERVLAEIG